ncbi:hypothetical protein F0726_03009 [Acidithiobacillus caldus]|nr:hypothetical protein F0726_03009 [Acidithiobacillus caldus]
MVNILAKGQAKGKNAVWRSLTFISPPWMSVIKDHRYRLFLLALVWL